MIQSAVRLLPGVVAALLLWSGSAQAQGVQMRGAPSSNSGWEESGQASWYGGRHNGRRTTSGAVFNQNAMTAAHSSLPLGTRVRVTVDDTGESVVVTITDRQPPKGLRVIDLSRGAAARIGLVARGTGMVTLSSADDAPEEVAEAADEPEVRAASPRRRGRPHTRRASRGA